MPRKSLIDEFAPPETIKPLRAPRASDGRNGNVELVAALDKLRRLVDSRADKQALAIAIGELRASLNFVRADWGLSAVTASEVQAKRLTELEAKYKTTVQRHSPEAEQALRRYRQARLRRS